MTWIPLTQAAHEIVWPDHLTRQYSTEPIRRKNFKGARKLTDDQVRLARKRSARGAPDEEIAEDLDMSVRSVRQMLRGFTYGDVK